jgi:ATP-binding cassette subfamily B protein
MRLLQVVQKYGAENIGQHVMLDLRIKVYRQLHDMPFDFFAKQKPGEAVSHVLNDVQGVGGVVSNTLVDLAQNAIVFCCTLIFIFALDWRLALIAVSFFRCSWRARGVSVEPASVSSESSRPAPANLQGC